MDSRSNRIADTVDELDSLDFIPNSFIFPEKIDTPAGSIQAGAGPLGMLLGRSPLFLREIEKLRKICRTEAPVLLEGETGTGKELFARAIHYLGRRAKRPFIPLNCGAIPDHLFENELFGHERGAYTDAGARQDGLVREADGGTLFLDEINSLSLIAQAKLLRLLEDRSYKPLGSSRYQRADIRFIFATNHDLCEQVRMHEFREDLFYRINVLSMTLPPLRFRTGDVIFLARHFLNMFSRGNQMPSLCFSDNALNALEAHTWPGNVRELRNTIEKAVIMASTDVLQPSDLGLDALTTTPAEQSQFRTCRLVIIKEFESRFIRTILGRTDGNITKSAKIAGMDRRSLQRLIARHGLNAALRKRKVKETITSEEQASLFS